jgi:predicted DNA-binding transcriptional regulator YafY
MMGLMTGTTGRVLQLLELLQSSQTRSVAELAERLGVGERTVRRYVTQLIDLEIPVESVRGRYGGYRIAPGYRVPPLMLEEGEAVAVALSLLRAQSTDEGETLPARTALAKIVRSLPPTASRSLDALLAGAVLRSPAAEDVPDASILLTVADAVRTRRALDMRYRNAADEPSRRVLHPYDLVARNGRWYVVGLDLERAAERVFRVDRIRTARALIETFPAPAQPRDAAERLVEGFADADYRWHVVLRIRAEQEEIRRHLPESVARLTPLAGEQAGWHRADIRAERLDWLPAVIAAVDGTTVVEAPEELRGLVRAAAHRLLAAGA